MHIIVLGTITHVSIESYTRHFIPTDSPALDTITASSFRLPLSTQVLYSVGSQRQECHPGQSQAGLLQSPCDF